MSGNMMMTLVTIVALLVAVAAVSAFFNARQRERERSEARVAALAAALDPQSADSYFTFAARPSGPRHPLLTVAAGFAVVTTAIVAGAVVAGMRSAPSPPAVGSSAATTGEPQLALIALRSDREGDTLVVKGLVENRGASPPAGVTAVVLAFSREGRLLARSSGPLRMQSRRGDGRADFVARVAGAADAARYQVSFRGPEGIIRHVDLRDRTGGGSPAGSTAAASRMASTQADTVSP